MLYGDLHGKINPVNDIFNVTNINPKTETYSDLDKYTNVLYMDRYLSSDIFQNNKLTKTYGFSILHDITFNFDVYIYSGKTTVTLKLTKGTSVETTKSATRQFIAQAEKHYTNQLNEKRYYRWVRCYYDESFRPCMQIQG